MSDVKSRAGRHRASAPARKDGLTDAQRMSLLVSFRAGIGSKPADTEMSAHHSDLVMDKLVDAPIRRSRR